ncbi:MAG: efflux RND transporter permease subunit [Planctomycetota bacterium]
MPFFGWLSELAQRYPLRFVAGVIIVLAASLPGLWRLELRTDGHALVPRDAPEAAVDAAVRKKFGITDPLIVLVRTEVAGGILTQACLDLVARLSTDLAKLDGIAVGSVRSLATEPSDRFRPGTIQYYPLLEPFPATPAELERLRGDLRALEIYHGILVANDESSAAIVAGVADEADRIELYVRVRKLVASSSAVVGARVDVIGAPVAEALLGVHILNDLGIPTRFLRDAHVPRGELLANAGITFHARDWLAEHIGLLPVALLTMFGVFLAAFRSFKMALLPLFEVGTCLVFVFGIMGYCGTPVYLTTAVLPIILAFVGVTDDIHVLARYRARRGVDPDGTPTAVRQVMRELVRPLVLTSLTTGCGFFSFVFAPLEPLKAFGAYAVLGVAYCLVWSLCLTPVLLLILKPRGSRAAVAERGVDGGPWGVFVVWLRRSRGVVLVGALAIAVLSPFGISKVQVQDSWIDGFSPESEFRAATEHFNAHYFGAHLLQLQVTAPNVQFSGEIGEAQLEMTRLNLPVGAAEIPKEVLADPRLLSAAWLTVSRIEPKMEELDGKLIENTNRSWTMSVSSASIVDGVLRIDVPTTEGSARFSLQPRAGEKLRYEIHVQGFMRPPALARLKSFAQFLAGQADLAVGGVLSAVNYLETTQYIMKTRAVGGRTLPEVPRPILVLWRNYERLRGAPRRGEVMSDDYSQTLLTVFLRHANFVDTAELLARMRDYAERELRPAGFSIEVAGDVAVSQSMIRAVVDGQVRSIVGSLVSVLLVCVLLQRSLKRGVLCVIPCTLALALSVAGMGWLGVPLGVATSMFLSMTLGIGVDHGIYLVDRYRAHRAERSSDGALVAALGETGASVVIDALAVSLGFGVLVLSTVPANARLGILSVTGIAACLLATLLILSALLLSPVQDSSDVGPRTTPGA